MSRSDPDRKQLLEHIVAALQPLDFIHAVWEAGSIAFGRNDQWSDIDLYIVVNDDKVEDVFATLDGLFGERYGIELKFRLPEPTWHGHSQAFYRLKNISPYCFIDAAVMKLSSKDKFLQYKIHGAPVIHFDKKGIVKDDPVNDQNLLIRIKKRLEVLKTTFPLFQVLINKELNRKRYVEAYAFYQGSVIRPLVEILRIKYSPFHFNFHVSYAFLELPEDVYKRLQDFIYIKDHEDLARKQLKADEWFWDVYNSIKPDDIVEILNSVK
ncbi:hypothetical protein A2Y85_01190 [candidate division WOR-3 bacterium RBG_13_43_14]|uniref:Polymerase nucleotidyl transferase domain-containing protein n=1 Tax=candidate division WOR-3 bacterium RBG_13_43_14 TaxID=1802590 RepID=A0A1F4UHW5_UNCW3|nr:MAG: hypothetical protein A2Y85_01190 [candidate division WOR-3 bacterium RBG_13_43_14]